MASETKKEESPLKVLSREEALWTRNRNNAKAEIQMAQDRIIVNTAVLKMCEHELLKLKRAGKK